MSTRTLYMHTLDGKPANFECTIGFSHLYVVCGISRVKLVPSLRQIRREQRACIADNTPPKISGERLDYVLVEVPRA